MPTGVRYSSILVSALLLSVIYVITSSPLALAEEENVVTETADEVSAASGSNRFVVWQDDTPGNEDILFKRSTDSGATWKATINLSNNAGRSVVPEITVSGSNVYVVWQDHTPGNIDIFLRRSTDNGATWKAIVNLSNNAGVSRIPQVTASGSNVYVVWEDQTPDNADVFMRRSTDNGATWKAAVNLSNNAGSSFDSQIAVSGSKVYVTWQDNTPGTFKDDIMFRRSTDNGATWKAVVNLSNNAGSSLDPQIAVSGSNVYVVWGDNTCPPPPFKCNLRYDIRFIRSTDNGATWKAVVNISKNPGDSAIPQIAVSGSNVYITWSDNTPGNYEVLFRRSTDNGATWKAAAMNLSNNASESSPSQIAVSGSNVYVVWYDSTPGNADIFMTRSTDNGATMQPLVQISSNAGGSVEPQVTAVGSNVYVVWQDSTPGNYDILSRRSTDNASTWNGVKNLSTNSGDSQQPQVAG